MNWIKQENLFYFALPPRTEGLSSAVGLTEHYEHIAGRGGWSLENNGSQYMIPDPIIDRYNQEMWIGVRRGKEQLVHCMNPEFRRAISPDDTNLLTKVYEQCGYPAFYRIIKESTERKTMLMTAEEVVDYCDGWKTALSSFPQEVVFKVPASLMFKEYILDKNVLMDHLTRSGEKWMRDTEEIQKLLDEQCVTRNKMQ